MDIQFNKNEDEQKLAWGTVKKQLEKIHEGGGKKAIEKQKEKNKLVARERIAYLCDADKPFIEIGAFAGFGMYEEYGGCPAGGTVSGIGYVSGRQCIIVANDQTVKAGAFGAFNVPRPEAARSRAMPKMLVQSGRFGVRLISISPASSFCPASRNERYASAYRPARAYARPR